MVMDVFPMGMDWVAAAEVRPISLHPVRDPRFASFWTQPLENLSAAVKLPIKKRFLGNPTLGTNLGQRILAMRTGCTNISLHDARSLADASRTCQVAGPCRKVATDIGILIIIIIIIIIMMISIIIIIIIIITIATDIGPCRKVRPISLLTLWISGSASRFSQYSMMSGCRGENGAAR